MEEDVGKKDERKREREGGRGDGKVAKGERTFKKEERKLGKEMGKTE